MRFESNQTILLGCVQGVAKIGGSLLFIMLYISFDFNWISGAKWWLFYFGNCEGCFWEERIAFAKLPLSLLHHSRCVHFRLFLQLPGATPANVAGKIGSLPGKVAPSKESSSKGRTVAEDSVYRDERLTEANSTLVDVKDDKELSGSGDEEPLKAKRSVLVLVL